MDLQTLSEKCEEKQCPRFDERKHRLQTLEWIRTRQVYKKLELPDFGNRRNEVTKKYRPVGERRPAARYDVPEIVVRDIGAMLSGDGRFPIVTFGDPNEQPETPEAPPPLPKPGDPPPDPPAPKPPTQGQLDTKAFAELVRVTGLTAIINRAVKLASIGSVVIVPEVIAPLKPTDPPWLSWTMWRAFEVDPVFRRDRPDVLEKVTRTWLVNRAQLVADGYDLATLDKAAAKKIQGIIPNGDPGTIPEYKDWYRRCTLDDNRLVNFEPVPKELYHRKDFADADWIEDPNRTFVHALGFCPAVWHITVEDEDARPDGACIFEGAIDDALLVDRVLSVAVNAIFAAGTPQLAISTGGASTGGGAVDDAEGSGIEPGVREYDPDSVIEVGEKNGAWLVQLEGGLTPLDAVIERLISVALENVGGSRMRAETLAGAKSGYAMELLNQALTYVAGLLRPALERTILALVRMIARMQQKFPGLACEGGEVPEFDAEATVKAVSYGPNYELSGQDKGFEVTAIVAAVAAGLLSSETAIAQVAQLFDVTDIETEVAKVKVEQQQIQATTQKNALELATAAPPKEGAPK